MMIISWVYRSPERKTIIPNISYKKQDVSKLGSPVPTVMSKELCEKS